MEGTHEIIKEKLRRYFDGNPVRIRKLPPIQSVRPVPAELIG